MIQEPMNGAWFQSKTVVFLWENALSNLLVFATQFYKDEEWNKKQRGIISNDLGDLIRGWSSKF